MMCDARELPELPCVSPPSEIVVHLIERHGKTTPIDLLQWAAAARLAGNHEKAANFVELAKTAQVVFLTVAACPSSEKLGQMGA